jgi:uncharacterized membrane protein YfcA
MSLAFTFSGFVVGAIVGMTGVGGGSLMTPLLVLMFGIAPNTAIATDLLYASITKSGGMFAHAKRGGVDWRMVGLLAAGSVPASLFTMLMLHRFDLQSAHVSAVLTTALGVALLLTASVLIFRERITRFARRVSERRGGPSEKRTRTWTVLTGIVLGTLVTLSSVGAGALGVAALTMLAPGAAAVRIVGTDIAHAVPLTLVAGLGHAAGGTVDWALLGSLLVGSLPGIWLGSQISHKLPERLLRNLLAAMLILIGGRLAL